MRYFEGFVVPVPKDKQTEYRAAAAKVEPMFREFGALRHMEAWEDDVPSGTRTDFRRAVAAEPGEAIVFAWIEYPDAATRASANERMMSDGRMQDMGDMSFDMGRMIYGGFEAAYTAGPGGAAGYVDATLKAVSAADRDAYLADMRPIADFVLARGALRIVEGWAVDVPEGKVTDFHRAVARGEGERVTFSWIEWPTKEVRNIAWGAMMNDPAMQGFGRSFDGKRMVHGGFAPIFDWAVHS